MSDQYESVDRAMKGDKGAFEELVRAHQATALSLAYVRLRDWGRAEDASQEAFLQVYQNLHRLRSPEAFPAWFLRILHSCCIRQVRRKSLPVAGEEEALGLRSEEALPEEQVILHEENEAIRLALRELTQQEQQAVALYYWADLSQAEIAETLSITKHMVNNSLYRARRKLKERLLTQLDERIGMKERVDRMTKQIIRGIGALHRNITKEGQPGRFTGQVCSLVGAMTLAMQSLNEEITYEDAMGLSGAAFRVVHRTGDWDYSEVDGLIGADLVTPFLRAMGHGFTFHYGKSKQQLYHRLASYDCTAEYGVRYETDEEIKSAIVCSVDEGFPVVAIDLIHVPEWGVITGYEDRGEKLYCRTYFDAEQGDLFAVADKLPWFAVALSGRVERPSGRDSLMQALRTAVKLYKTSAYEVYINGLNAYDAWARELVDEQMERISERTLGIRASVHACALASLKDARSAGAVYLRNSARWAGEGETALLEAADLCERMVVALDQLWDADLLPPADGRGVTRENWSDKKRRANAEALMDLKDLDCEILAIFEAILADQK